MAPPRNIAAPSAESAVPNATAAATDAASSAADAMKTVGAEVTAKSQDTFARFRTATEGADEAAKSSYGAATQSLSVLGQKALETARANTNAAFDHALSLLGAKSMSDAIELNTAFARRQMEAVAQQAREMTELVQSAATKAAEPIKAQVEKVLKSGQ